MADAKLYRLVKNKINCKLLPNAKSKLMHQKNKNTEKGKMNKRYGEEILQTIHFVHTLRMLIHGTLWRAHACMSRPHSHTFHLTIMHFISHPLVMHCFHRLEENKPNDTHLSFAQEISYTNKLASFFQQHAFKLNWI